MNRADIIREMADAMMTIKELSRDGKAFVPAKPSTVITLLQERVKQLEETVAKASARRDKWKALYLEAFARKQQQEGGGT